MGRSERKHYIDNLRSMAILLLFPVHTFMIWNDFGSGFYIWVGENKLLSTLIVLVNPWFMPLLFALAGMSARFALEKRTVREFIRQRVFKLLLPLVAGMVFLVPFQTYFARKYFYGYEGKILSHWKYFFTHVTDLSGYDGAFTPGHLWFILFLFIISMAALLLFHFLPYKKLAAKVEKISAVGLLCLFIPIWLMYYLGNFGGYSIGKNFALYLMGYYVLSNDAAADRLAKNSKWIIALCAGGTVALTALYYRYSYYGDLWVNFIGWISILALLILGKKMMNVRMRFMECFHKMSYSVYILHLPILAALAYYVAQMGVGLAVQVIFIGFGSFALTLAACLPLGLLRMRKNKKEVL